MKLNKKQLDVVATVLGAVAGIATVLGTQQIINPRLAGTISGVSTVLLGVVTQRPADSHPTTEEVEQGESNG